jgi:hypothetical protein
MYPNGPISHERHHFVFFLEIEANLKAELDAEEGEDDEDLPSNHDDDTGTDKSSADHNSDDKDDDDDDDDVFLPTSPYLPTASEICANASYDNRNTKKSASRKKNTVTNLIKAKFNEKMSSTRRQTDETVGLDFDEEEDLLRQVYRHDSLVQRLSSSFTRRLSDYMQNLALETSQRDGLAFDQEQKNKKYNNVADDDGDSIDFVDSKKDAGDDNYTYKVGECFEMDVFADHRAPMGNNSMDSIATAPTSNTNRKQRRSESATSTNAINDALLRVLEDSSGSSCNLSDDDLVPAEVQIGDIARRMDRRYSRRRSFTNAYAA